MSAALSRTISRPNRQVCDRLHGGPTAKRLAVFAAVDEAAFGPTCVAAQPSKYQCDGNDEHDAGGNHQNLEDVIARSVMV
jgi:hypothetical protein